MAQSCLFRKPGRLIVRASLPESIRSCFKWLFQADDIFTSVSNDSAHGCNLFFFTHVFNMMAGTFALRELGSTFIG